MLKYLALAMVICTPAVAQQADELTFKLNMRDLEVISDGLTQMPWKVSNQTIQKLQAQVLKQQQDAQAARDAKIIEDAKKADAAK